MQFGVDQLIYFCVVERKTPFFKKSTLTKALGDGLTAEGPLVNFVKNNVTSWPFLLLKHHLPMDFEKYNIQQPTYINVIRDPADWFQSHYYFERFGWTRKEDDRGSFNGSEEDKQRVSANLGSNEIVVTNQKQ